MVHPTRRVGIKPHLGRVRNFEEGEHIAAARIQPTQGVAVLVQRADYGPVIGCNKLEPAYFG